MAMTRDYFAGLIIQTIYHFVAGPISQRSCILASLDSTIFQLHKKTLYRLLN